MWPGALGSKENVSYMQQYNSLKEALRQLEIDCLKATHLWRVAGAQQMDAAGVADDVRCCVHALSFTV